MPKTITPLKGKNKVQALSLFARKAAEASSVKSGFDVHAFEKDTLGAPRPNKGIFWSVSHKQNCVAGVVSNEKIGIDLEQIKKVSERLFKKILDPDEAGLFKNQDKPIVFFRVFTAKEAVLKKTTHGIKGLSKVKIKRVIDDKSLEVQYLDKKYLVENFYFDGYIASVTKDDFDVQWTME